MEKPKAYIKKTVTLLIETSVGDHWKSDDCEFVETKDENTFIVDLKK